MDTRRADASSREALIGAVLTFLADQDLLTLRDIRSTLEREIDRAGPAALHAMKTRLRADLGWDYYPPDPLAQRIHHVLADTFLHPESQVSGLEHLDVIPPGPLAIFANHLSYSDANLVEVLLQRAGSTALANRLTAIAGPKVFTSPQRRFSSLCFGTIKVPQSAAVSSEEAMLSAREVARAARQAIDVAHERLRAGDALLLFAEGSRSRTGGMQEMLAGVARYLEVPGTTVLPGGPDRSRGAVSGGREQRDARACRDASGPAVRRRRPSRRRSRQPTSHDGRHRARDCRVAASGLPRPLCGVTRTFETRGEHCTTL